MTALLNVNLLLSFFYQFSGEWFQFIPGMFDYASSRLAVYGVVGIYHPDVKNQSQPLRAIYGGDYYFDDRCGVI